MRWFKIPLGKKYTLEGSDLPSGLGRFLVRGFPGIPGFRGFWSEKETLVDRDRELKNKYGKLRIVRVKRSLGGQNLNPVIFRHTALALGDSCFMSLELRLFSSVRPY